MTPGCTQDALFIYDPRFVGTPGQKSANFSSKGPDSKYFWLFRPHIVSVTFTQIFNCKAKTDMAVFQKNFIYRH